mmetsp:Transcript_69406/g.104704  ORF Transcript_69406/g.104704 Transcript_69406/m.104704 type:complete len:354 (+) Transcript_69406:28-1089(+)
MSEEKKKVIVWTDGCFDMMHYGHANALRQAKALGDYLIVGVHSDADISAHKGPPVMNEQDRYKAAYACKWVDEVVEGAPFVTDVNVLRQHNVDLCVHGDDIITDADGNDCYAEVKKAGMFRTVPRTQGVSTTDLVGRMLLMTKTHHSDPNLFDSSDSVKSMDEGSDKESPYTRLSRFMPTTRQIVQFSEGKSPKEGDKIGYIDGAFDLFHVGHISILEKAKSNCDYLIVGVHDDATVNKEKGENHPLSNLHERVLGVLSCRYVDEVIIGAPYIVDTGLLKGQGISVVFAGTERDVPVGPDPYALAREAGILSILESPSKVTTSTIIEKILANSASFRERNRKKQEKERLAAAN